MSKQESTGKPGRLTNLQCHGRLEIPVRGGGILPQPLTAAGTRGLEKEIERIAKIENEEDFFGGSQPSGAAEDDGDSGAFEETVSRRQLEKSMASVLRWWTRFCDAVAQDFQVPSSSLVPTNGKPGRSQDRIYNARLALVAGTLECLPKAQATQWLCLILGVEKRWVRHKRRALASNGSRVALAVSRGRALCLGAMG